VGVGDTRASGYAADVAIKIANGLQSRLHLVNRPVEPPARMYSSGWVLVSPPRNTLVVLIASVLG